MDLSRVVSHIAVLTGMQRPSKASSAVRERERWRCFELPNLPNLVLARGIDTRGAELRARARSGIGGRMSAGAVLPFWLNRPPEEALEVAANAARLGYDEIWIGEMLHFDAFALAGAVARMSDRPIITVGPLPIDLRDPVALAMGIGSIAVIGGRPARLAVGASSPAVVERWHGRRWSGQAERLEEGVRLIRSVLEGERTDHSGKHFQTKGFRSALGHQTAHITVAALGPRMTAVAARCGDRLVMNLVSVEQVAAAARAVAIPIAVWVVAGVEPTDEGWDQVRRQMAHYLRAPGYSSALTAAGLGDLVEAAGSDRPVSDLAALVTPDHLEAITAIGSEDRVMEKLGRYREAGAEVMVVPITAGDPAGHKTLTALRGM